MVPLWSRAMSPTLMIRWAASLLSAIAIEMGNELFTHPLPERVLQLCLLDEQIVLWGQLACSLWAFEVEAEPLLDPALAGAPSQIHQQGEVEHNRRGQDAVTTEEVNLELHRIAQPSEEVDVIPAF